MNENRGCTGCKHLVLSENDQKYLKEHLKLNLDHRCSKYNKVLFHNGRHPEIDPCNICKEDMKEDKRINLLIEEACFHSSMDIITKLIDIGLIQVPIWYPDTSEFKERIIKLSKNESVESLEFLRKMLIPNYISRFTDMILKLIPNENKICTVEFRERIEKAIIDNDIAFLQSKMQVNKPFKGENVNG